MKYISLPLVCVFLLMSLVSAASANQAISDNETALLYNRGNIIPFRSLADKKIAIVVPSQSAYAAMIEMSRNYAHVDAFEYTHFSESTKFYNTIILAGTNGTLSQSILLEAGQAASNGKEVVLCTFVDGKENIALLSPRFAGRATELVAPGTNRHDQENMAMSLFGGLGISKGTPGNQTPQTRIQYGNVDRSKWNIRKMTEKIDAIAAEAIREKAAPGMVVMALKDGKVLFHKAYGHHTYDESQATDPHDIFDLASISKIVGTTPVVMHLMETGQIELDKSIGDYLWDTKQTDIANIPLRTVLLHEAGFRSFIPFYRDLKPGDLQPTPSETHQVKVADGAYLRNNYYRDVMWPEMIHSPVKPPGNYVYSDISLYVLKEVTEQVSSTPMDEHVTEFLYKPIGMQTAGYNPRNRFDKYRIVPTQNDTAFRKTLLHGHVHDEGAAMAGGVAGHAGLFSSANDLAIYGQMLLNKGTYGGVKFFEPQTVELFTSNQSKTSRRGLGFDRFAPDSQTGYPSKLANNSVYGHTGYTGTCIWIDPQNQFVYIFLSNRVHPQVSNKLGELSIRGRIQDAIYETINAK